MLRAADFPTAAPGPWPIPSIPLHVPVPDYLFRLIPQLKRQTISPTPPQRPVTRPLVTRRPEPPTLARLLWTACWHPVQGRILRSLTHRPDGRCRKRRLQQALHRIPARELNPALDRLVAAGLVVRDGEYLALDPEARRELLKARGTVSRIVRARAMARERARRSRQRARVRERQRGTENEAIERPSRRRPYRPRRAPDQRRNRSSWGRSMRSKKGGYAVQKLCRRVGVHPTAAATAARQQKRAQEQRPHATLTLLCQILSGGSRWKLTARFNSLRLLAI
jgi:hypothetical protein